MPLQTVGFGFFAQPRAGCFRVSRLVMRVMTRRLTRRKNRPAERRDVAHGYVMPETA
ncbi:hypothetical protein AB0L75_35485 [Streptomyces sp. NPDC052101]|uniref:hypothetical protein n=1 Tax=Streptomyces sp. NPDC052101 TaxID=3155763 RepID=UPI0034141C96